MNELATFRFFFSFFFLQAHEPLPSPPTETLSPPFHSSYGVVYLAIDRQTGEEVAVKAMSKRRPKSTRERTLKKLVREAALQARVQHCSGVVKLLGAYEVRGVFFFFSRERYARAPSRFLPFAPLRLCFSAIPDERGRGKGFLSEERRCRNGAKSLSNFFEWRLNSSHGIAESAFFFCRFRESA